jgi:streptogramin lyase
MSSLLESRRRPRRNPRSLRLGVEDLESRQLLAVSIIEHPVQAPGYLFGVEVAPDGHIWMTGHYSALVEFDPATETYTEYKTPNPGGPFGITLGPDGNIWYTSYIVNRVGVIDLQTHEITEFPLADTEGYPDSITTGPDGNLWVSGNGIFTVNPTTHEVNKVYGGPQDQFYGITVGPDGDIWSATQTYTVRIDAETGEATTLRLFSTLAFQFDSEGKLWYTDGSRISYYDPETQQSQSFETSGTPRRIAIASDGAVWFTTYGYPTYDNGRVGRIDPETYLVKEYATPWPTSDSLITPGADNTLWFTGMVDQGAGKGLGEIRYTPDTLTLDPIDSPTVAEGGTVSFIAAATDTAVGAIVSYSLDAGAPAGASIDPATGAFTWTATTAGVYTLTVRATDDSLPPLVDAKSFTITVTAAPVPDPVPPPPEEVVPPPSGVSAAGIPSGYGPRRDAFVGRLYGAILGRNPESAGLNFWSGRLAAGASTRTVALAIFRSPEHKALIRQGVAPRVGFLKAFQLGQLAAKAHPANALAYGLGRRGDRAVLSQSQGPLAVPDSCPCDPK